MSRISILCPHCGREGKLPESIKTIPTAVKCPGCLNQFQPIPADEFIVVPDSPAKFADVAKSLANGVTEKAKETASRVKDYATSDEARAAMDAARQRAGVVGEKAKEAVSDLRKGDIRVWENPVVVAVSLLFPPLGFYLIWRHPLWSKKTKWIWASAFVGLLLIGSMVPDNRRKQHRDDVAEATSRTVPAQENNIEFSSDDLQVINSDPNLRIANEMKFLSKDKLEKFLRRREKMSERHIFNGTFEYSVFLEMIPSGFWFEAAHKRGLTQTEFRQTTNLLFTMDDGTFDPGNNQIYNMRLKKLTGSTIEEY